MNEMLNYGYFPRLHTAVSEWLACIILLIPSRKRFGKTTTVMLSILMLPLLIFTNMPAEGMRGWLWFIIVGLAVYVMYILIRLLTKTGRNRALYCMSLAFVFSEMAAALEWQLNSWLVRQGLFTTLLQVNLFMVVAFLLLYGLLLILVRIRVRKDEDTILRTDITGQQALAYICIAIGTFLLSNVSFGFPDSSLLGTLNASALHVRTVVDIGGLCLLYAFEVQRREFAISRELHATETILKRQYELYQQFEANSEVMHRVYHDLKHQIQYLEMERDANRRSEALSEMKETILRQEARINTGNSVLDTLMTGKNLVCVEEDITMTCYANAEGAGFISTMDLCAILGNALDNAIEYVKTLPEPEQRLIRVIIHQKDGFLIIRVENYCDTLLQFHHGLPATTKADRQMHGYGLKSIRLAVEKYQGALNVRQEEDWFILDVMIPLPLP